MTITDFQWVHLGSPGAYLIENDGTDSTFHYSPTFPDAGATWTSEPITGVYTKIRVGSTAGQVYILTQGGASVTDSFLSGDGAGSWTLVPFGAGAGCVLTVVGTYNAGQDRFEGTYCVDGDGKFCKVELDLGVAATIVSVEVDVDWEATLVTGSPFFSSAIDYDGVNVANSANNSPGVGPETLTYDTLTGGVTVVGVYSTAFTNVGDGFTYITGIRITYVPGGTVQTKYSSNYGATFASARTAGDSPGAYAGVDTQKIGTVTMVGTDGQVMIATTAGGTYSAYGDPMPAGAQPNAIRIPRYKTNGSSNSGSTPDYIVASNMLTVGNEALWYVSTGGTVFTDITPVITGDYGLAVSEDCIDNAFRSGTRYAAVLDFDGSTKLVTSINAGSTWANRDTIVGALSVRYRRGDTSLQQLYIACAGGLVVSLNGGAMLHTRLSPGAIPLLGAEPMD